MANGDDDENGHGPPIPRRRGSSIWDERRLDEFAQQLYDLRRDIARLWEEVRRDARSGDGRDARISRLDEKLTDAARRVEGIAADLGKVREEAEERYVLRSEFDPVRKAVFALIGSICLAVLAAVGRLVMK